MARIIFLGTGGGYHVVGKQISASGGIVIQIDDQQYVIDPGPGCLVKAKEYGVNLRETSAIIVTHNHLGHCNDINAVIDAMTLNGLDKRGILVTVKGVVEGFLTDYHKEMVEKLILLEKGKKMGINEVEIEGIESRHDVENVGLKIITPEFILGYISDTKYFKELPDNYKGCDILIINQKLPSEEKSDKNLNGIDTVKIINKIKPKLVMITHFGLKMLKKGPLIEARELQRATYCQVIAAKDGMIINPTTHASKIRQKTLNIFKEGEKEEGKLHVHEEEEVKEKETIEKNETQQFLDGFQDIDNYLDDDKDD
ncbi:MBL fold metallo-hydrolase [Nanoarchaeota archaeon]